MTSNLIFVTTASDKNPVDYMPTCAPSAKSPGETNTEDNRASQPEPHPKISVWASFRDSVRLISNSPKF